MWKGHYKKNKAPNLRKGKPYFNFNNNIAMIIKRMPIKIKRNSIETKFIIIIKPIIPNTIPTICLNLCLYLHLNL